MLIHKALRCGLAEVGARQTLKISPALHSSPRLFPFPSDQSRAESDGSEISQQADTDTSPRPVCTGLYSVAGMVAMCSET